MDARFMI